MAPDPLFEKQWSGDTRQVLHTQGCLLSAHTEICRLWFGASWYTNKNLLSIIMQLVAVFHLRIECIGCSVLDLARGHQIKFPSILRSTSSFCWFIHIRRLFTTSSYMSSAFCPFTLCGKILSAVPVGMCTVLVAQHNKTIRKLKCKNRRNVLMQFCTLTMGNTFVVQL